MPDSLSLLTPEVRTLARPTSGALVAARYEVQRSPTLKAAFEHAKLTSQSADLLAGAIIPELETLLTKHSFEEIHEAAQYLADEYAQVGDKVLVIDRISGKALAALTEEDFWTPPPTTREDGRLVQREPRLRPDVEGFVISWVFNEHRDQEVQRAIAARLHQTTALAVDGDPRLLPTTRAGRAQMASNLRDDLPSILQNVGGTSRAFLDLFEVWYTPPLDTQLKPGPRCIATAQSRQGVQDAKTFNLRHDRAAALRSRIGTSWARDIARTFSLSAHQERTPIIRQASDEAEVQGNFWVADPDLLRVLHKARVLYMVEGALPVHTFASRVGVIVIHPDGFNLRSREVHDRWDIVAQMEYTLYVNWEYAAPYLIEGVVPEVAAEIF